MPTHIHIETVRQIEREMGKKRKRLRRMDKMEDNFYLWAKGR